MPSTTYVISTTSSMTKLDDATVASAKDKIEKGLFDAEAKFLISQLDKKRNVESLII